MKISKSYSIIEVLNYSNISLMFEFYTTKNTNFVVSDLSSIMGKNIILCNEILYNPTYENSILLKEYDSSRSRYKLYLASQNYNSIITLLNEINIWLSENCETTYDTGLKIGLSFDHFHLDTLSKISGMNPTRLMLKFDENYIYERFPERKNSPYSLSIKSLAPISGYINESEIEKNINYIMSTPRAEYYGINFKNHTQGILECNYIGGKNYPEKTKEIKDIIEYFIIKTYQSINESELNEYEKNEIKKISTGFDKIQMAFYDSDVFLNEFKNIKVYVDLKTSRQLLKTYWDKIRGPLFEMILNGGLKEGYYNYDSQIGRFQLKRGKINGTIVHDIDLINCKLTGVFEKCQFVSCDISKARLYNSALLSSNKIKESFLSNVNISKSNELNNCFVINNEEIIDCKVNESVIKFATIGKNFKGDEKSSIIVKENPLPKKDNAVIVDEIRDYSWIKGMNKSEDLGFQNIYDRNKYKK